MERRYSIQPVIRRDGKEEEERRLMAAYEAGRRGSEAGRRGSEAGRRGSETSRRGSEAIRRESEAGRRDSEAGRRGSTAPIIFNKNHSWVKRSNLTPDSIRPFPETRASWDESMRRRDSQKGVGLKGIQLRKGFSDDRKNYISIFQTEGARRMSRPSAVAAATQPPAYFSPNQRLCKWETVNLTSNTDLERAAKVETIMEDSSDTSCNESGTDTNDESSATGENAAAAGARPKTYRHLLLKKLTSREDSGIDLNPLVTIEAASPGHAIGQESSTDVQECGSEPAYEDRLQEEAEDFVQDTDADITEEAALLQDERKYRSTLEENIIEETSEESTTILVLNDFKASSSTDALKKEGNLKNKSLARILGQEDSKAPKRDSISLPVERPESAGLKQEERRASVVPLLNIPKEQNNLEKFLDILNERQGKTGGGSDTEVNLMAADASGNTLAVGISGVGEEGISRARSCEHLRPRRDESRPLWDRRHRPSQFSPGTRPILLNIESIDDWAVSARTFTSSIVETSGMYICKEAGSRGDGDYSDMSANASGDESWGGSGALTRSGSKLRKPTNLWGVTRRISVKRKKVTEKREFEAELQQLQQQQPVQQQPNQQQQQQQQSDVSPR
ncbi:hypothetical protein ElyMa_003561100 [Elysia marginata]|uniref:Ig-like domain-containing protein n=1 Tax=Elysia marginata TaxID=1093978 RepID=A0AAV4EKP8_9GAST|nr:hypothetical protein ElyMa_003561100 [Elysia marginata]